MVSALSIWIDPVPGSYNDQAMNLDEFNGGGINEPLKVNYWVNYTGLRVLVMTVAMQEVFDGCADYVVPCDTWQVNVPALPDTIVIRRAA